MKLEDEIITQKPPQKLLCFTYQGKIWIPGNLVAKHEQTQMIFGWEIERCTI